MNLISSSLRWRNAANWMASATAIIGLTLLFSLVHGIHGGGIECLAGQVGLGSSTQETPRSSSSAGTRVTLASAQTEPHPGQAVAAVPTLSQGDMYVLAVGISKYKNPSIPSLTCAAKDAKDFAAFLETQKGLFNKIKIELLTDEEATKAELEKYLMYKIRKAGKNDTTVLFLSGHGSADPKRAGQYFFVTYDADPEFLEATSVNMSGLGFLKELDCPRILLISDACHSGGFSEWKTKAVVSPLKGFMRDFASSAGKVVISSSRPDEYSLESPRRDNGVFTHWLLEALKGAADRDSDGVVTVNEAYNYAYQQTKVETEGAQHPQFQGTVEGIFPLAMTSAFDNRLSTVLEISADPPGADVFIGGRLAGKTDPEGAICLKYLPVGRPIPILVVKEGWIKQELAPVEFSQSHPHMILPRIALKPALASLEVATVPGDVSVKIDGRSAGKTNSSGKLIVHDVQVAVDHLIELEKQGFDNEATRVSIPVAYESKKAEMGQVRLSKVSTERPIDRIQKDYRDDRKQPHALKSLWGTTDLDRYSEQDHKLLKAFPGTDSWDLSIRKQSKFKGRLEDAADQKLRMKDMLPGRPSPGGGN